jgi:hypothetical protein
VAIDGSSSGRSVSTHTDEAGRFALTNLREGSTYTVIAEYEDADGAVHSSRRRVGVPQRHIELTPADRGAVAPARVGRASARREVREEAEPVPPPSNVEDLPIQADEEPAAGDDVDAWRSGSRSTARRPASPDGVAVEDDGPNPLPPAIEPRRHQPPPFEAVPSEGPAPPEFPPQTSAAAAAPSTPAPALDAPPLPAEPANESLIDEALSNGPTVPQAPGSGEPPAVVEPEFPPGLGGVPVEPGPPPMPPPMPVAAGEPAPLAVPDSSEGGPPAMDESPEAPVPRDQELPAAEPLVPPPADPPPAAPASPEGAASTAKGPTWGEVAARSPLADRSTRTTASLAPAKPRVERALDDVSRAPAGTARQPVRADCRYDARHRRLTDFTLPDLDGNAVRLQDLDADLVLLDFWGSWCGALFAERPASREAPAAIRAGSPEDRRHRL